MYEGSVSNYASSVAMLTWYQVNFTRVLNRLAGSEEMPG
jgi:hypothetical protein